MPADPVLAHVYHVASRRKRWVPKHWLDDDGPFPGQFRPAPSSAAVGGEDEGHPPLSASKSDWVEHAVAGGMSQTEAEGMSKADLIHLTKSEED